MWVVRIADGHGSLRLKNIAQADDAAPADGRWILTYLEACEAARRLARGESAEKPKAVTTLADVLDARMTPI